MGKSTLAKQARSLGIPVHDADACVHRLMQPDGEAFADIQSQFPEVIEGGVINRQKLGRIVFQDDEKRRLLESIIHPLVRAESARFIAMCQKARHKICILDIPLLFETGRHEDMDAVLTVSAPRFVQKRRVMARDNMTEDKLVAILDKQFPDHKKRAKSDYVILSARGLRHTLGQLRALKQKL